MRLAAGLLAIGLVGAACSETDTSSTTEGVVTTTAPPVTTLAPTTGGATTVPGTDGPSTTAAPTTEAGPDLVQWAVDYTGGKKGVASGDPVKIGYVNSEDFFPENTVGIEAAVDFVNNELGGVAGGHPIELVECVVATANDGARCAAEMANNSAISLVITGTLIEGNKAMYDGLNGKKAVIIGNGLVADDFTTLAGQAFTAGSPGVVPGLAEFVKNILTPKPKTVALIANDNASGQAAAGLLFGPPVAAAGITVTTVYVPDTATAADVQSQMVAAGVQTADVVVPLVTIQQCLNVYDSIKALGINPTVVSTGLCYGTRMTQHLKDVGVGGDVPEGWYFGGYGYSYFRPDYDSGMETYIAKINQYGKVLPGATSVEYTGFAGPSFANLLTAAKFMNELGFDKLDVASIDAKVRGFTGPMMIQAGPLACGQQVVLGLPIFKALCASQIGVQQYKGGEWISIADALNGKAIDITKVTN